MRHDTKLSEDLEREIADFLTPDDLGDLRLTEKSALGRKFSAAVTTIKVPDCLTLDNSFWELYQMNKVTRIEAADTVIESMDMRYIAKRCPQLSYLDVCECSLDIDFAKALADCTNLTYLDLCNCDVSDSFVVLLPHANLTYLNLCNCDVSDWGVSALSRINLTHLDLDGCHNVSDRGVMALSRCTSLTHLDLTDCHYVSDRGVRALTDCQQLSSLILSCCLNISDGGVNTLRQLPQLSTLGLNSCESVTSVPMLAGFPSLTSLDLVGWMITDAGMHELCTLNLTHLDLCGCEITDAGVAALSACPGMTSVILGWNKQITDAGVRALAACPHLSSLDLGGCDKITDVGVKALAQCRSLTYLDLRDTSVREEWQEEFEDAQSFFRGL